MAELKVLIIDDEPGIIRLCRRLLERAGFSVEAFTDPQLGLSALDGGPFDLLLVDIRMPGMDGFQVIDRARADYPDMAVVIMTGFGTVETAIEALRRGANGLVLKPFSGGDLVASVQRALQDSQQKQDFLRLQTLRPLFAITESLFAETNPERLRDLLLDAVCGNLRCSQTGFYHQTAPGLPFQLIGSRGNLPAPEVPVDGFSLSEFVLAAGSAVLVNFESAGEAGVRKLMQAHSTGALLGAPIPLKEGANFLLAARDMDEPRFRESDLEIFAILARQAAVALENARLHAELKANIRQVEESQQALIQAEKMAIAGRLTASIAHEINNPLQSVRNCLHLAGREELSPREQQEYMDLAHRELERLMNTVQRMLDYYRPGAVDRKPVDLNELIQRVLILVGKQLEEAGIRVDAHYSSRLKPVLAVADQIQQVLLNLILNSMEAMRDGGKISIETVHHRGTAVVNIEDTGPGVSPEQRKHIFEPFSSTKEGGTGLGLAVSYGIVAAHGGSLDLVTGRGRGACFRMILPSGDNPSGDGLSGNGSSEDRK